MLSTYMGYPCVLVNPTHTDYVQNIMETESECTLWGNLKVNDDMHFIIGAVFVPCDNACLYFNQTIDQTENDTEYFRWPVCFFAEFNAHTNLAIDLVDLVDTAGVITSWDQLYETESQSCNDLNARLANKKYNQFISEINKDNQNLLSPACPQI